MVAAASGLMAVGTTSFVTGYAGRPEGPGGLLGVFLHDELVPRFASLGALLILAATTLASPCGRRSPASSATP